jgi:hypothetical protein
MGRSMAFTDRLSPVLKVVDGQGMKPAAADFEVDHVTVYR